MMESPEMFTTLIGKNTDDEVKASDESVDGKAETFGVGWAAGELKSDVSYMKRDGVSVEEKIEEVVVGGAHGVVGVVKEEGNLVRSTVNGKECVDKGTKCSEFGVEVSGLEHARGEMKEDAVFVESLEGLEDVPVQQVDLGGNATNNSEAIQIQVAKLSDEKQQPQLNEDIRVGFCSDDFLMKMQNVDHKDYSFAIGDIVWCMAKNNIWWPALICDPSDVPKQSMKKWDSEKHLVRYFGSKTLVWCPPSHLKHFLESFKEMSSQGKSKSFLGAIEKAAEEVGRRVKLEMTCSCISKEIRARLVGRNKEDFKPWYISDDTLACHFDPIRFLERVKNLAMTSNVPDIVETIAARSNIAAYYAYFGHCQMYLRHLHDTDGPNEDVTALSAAEGMIFPTEHTEEGSDLGIEKDGQSLDSPVIEKSPKLSTEGTTENGFESRERKKSKYLSFPFIDPTATRSLRDPDSSEPYGKRDSSNSKRLLGKSIRKCATATSSGDLKDLKVSPAQLLTELRDSSQGYFYLNGNTILNSTFDFFCGFRRYTFNDGDSASNWYNEDGIVEKEGLEVQVASPLSEIKPAKKCKKSVTNKLDSLNSEPTMDQMKDLSLKACRETPVAKAVTYSRKRKESIFANHETNKTVGVLDLNSNGGSPGPHVYSSDKAKITEASSQPKKRKSELENCIIKAKPISLVVDLFFDSHSLAGLLEANVERHFGENPASLNAKTAPVPSLPENVNPASSELVKIPAQMELLPTDTSSDKKLKKPPPAENTSGLPDLNGNGHDPNSSVTFPKQSFPASLIPASPPAARVEEPPLSVIKSNLEMMTKMLEESGNNISPDMRAKLENDVQGLLKKITDMTGSSS